ncbi:trypsin-like serine protease [Micromonospora echinofusca]|uniref:Trypsin-like serine protease n=2 Tax=Micromonospora echinofusca TaxID=47858 RepID=A0ABS3VY78_MICEH|nr:trypsin-like serine protease [Micromonospora echinofusca]
MPAGAVRATEGAPRSGAYGNTFTNRSTRVVNGTPANASEFPSVVGIRTLFVGQDEAGNEDWYISTCTGTVLSSTKVLTAAHCTVDYPYGTTWVIAGRTNLDDTAGGFVARVATTWTHQGYNLAAQYAGTALAPVDDVSVLTLKDALPATYTPVQLSAQGDQAPYAEGMSATIAGYGMSDSADNSSSGILHKGTVQMKSNTTCSGEYGAAYDANRMICASGGTEPTATDTCHGDSGGPIFVAGKQVGITSWGKDPCGTAPGVYERLSYYNSSISSDLNKHGLVNLDWTGDGHSDLFVRTSDGELVVVTGSGLASDGFGGINYWAYPSTNSDPGYLTGNFTGYNKLFRTYNWNDDKTPSMMARDGSGNLYQWKTDGEGVILGGRTQIGSGWNSFTDIMVTNNWTGDGRPNLMGRKADGTLVLYTSNGTGGWTNPKGTVIGTGWNSFNVVLTPGSWLGDGKQSLIGRRPTGELILFNSDGMGGWSNPKGTQIGSGWGGFPVFLSPGDWSGDNLIDLVGVNESGALRLYTTNGQGAWLDGKGKQLDTGWNAFTAVF